MGLKVYQNDFELANFWSESFEYFVFTLEYVGQATYMQIMLILSPRNHAMTHVLGFER